MARVQLTQVHQLTKTKTNMASFPATIKSFIAKINGGVIDSSHINELQDEVTALESTVGVTNSAVATTIDYKLKNASSVNPGHKHTLAGALTDVEITSPTNGQGLVYETASSKWKNQTTSVADAAVGTKGINLMSVAPVSAASPIAVGDNDPRVPTQNENDALVGTSGTAVSSSNKLVDNADTATSGNSKVLRLNASGKILYNVLPVKKFGVASKNASDASATQNIAHGLGGVPNFVRIDALGSTGSNGITPAAIALYNGTTQSSASLYPDNANQVQNSQTFRITGTPASNPSYTEGVVTFDSTNIIITWTKTGAPTGTFNLLWTAE